MALLLIVLRKSKSSHLRVNTSSLTLARIPTYSGLYEVEVEELSVSS